MKKHTLEPSDCVGKKFGRLTIMELLPKEKNKHRIVMCKCDCGMIKPIRYNGIKNNSVVSCGCYNREYHARKKFRHGMINTKIYGVFQSMKERCRNSNNHAYSHYGGRGIYVCDEWMNSEDGFMDFYDWAMDNGYAEGLTLERIDNNKGYSPCNCKWTDYFEQQRNKRINKNNKSGTRGVSVYGDKFRANIYHNQRQIQLGIYDNVEDAVFARIQAEIKYWNKPSIDI